MGQIIRTNAITVLDYVKSVLDILLINSVIQTIIFIEHLLFTTLFPRAEKSKINKTGLNRGQCKETDK